ncbi:hypothetical protein ACI2OX_07450 [Bacillus sp. N9]
MKISDLIEVVPTQIVTINQERYEVQSLLLNHGVEAKVSDFVKDRDHITVSFPETIDQLLTSLHQSHLLKPFRMILNGKESFFPAFSATVLINGEERKYSDPFPANAAITIERKLEPTVGNLAQVKGYTLQKSISVIFNDQPIILEKSITKFFRGEKL